MESDYEGRTQGPSTQQDATRMRFQARSVERRGADIAKGIRSCTTGLFVPIAAIAVGIGVGQKAGWCLGILSGIASFYVAGHAFKRYVIAKIEELTISDCLLPMVMSLVCAVVFLPIKIIVGDAFSPITCIIAGLMMSFGMLAYRCGKLGSPWWLVPTAITFVYECLPFNLPMASLDDAFAVGLCSVNFFFMNVVGINWHAGHSFLSRTCQQERIEAINPEKYGHQKS